MQGVFEYFPLLFVAFGIVAIMMSVKGLVGFQRFAQRALRVPGVVSDVRTTFAGRGEGLKATHRPVLTFTTVDGREITTEASTASDLGVGNATEVLYDPQDPTSARPAHDTAAGYGGIVAGVIALGIGLAFFSAFSGVTDVTPGTDDGPAQCELRQPDGTFQPAPCPPGLDLDH